MNAGMTKCCTLYVSASQKTGLNRGDSAHCCVWTLSLPEKKRKRKREVLLTGQIQDPSYVLGAGPRRNGDKTAVNRRKAHNALNSCSRND